MTKSDTQTGDTVEYPDYPEVKPGTPMITHKLPDGTYGPTMPVTEWADYERANKL